MKEILLLSGQSKKLRLCGLSESAVTGVKDDHEFSVVNRIFEKLDGRGRYPVHKRSSVGGFLIGIIGACGENITAECEKHNEAKCQKK